MNKIERKKIVWQIIFFSIFVLVLSFVGSFLGGNPTKPGIGYIIWGIAPILIAILMRIINRDWSDSGFLLNIRKNIKWYIFILMICITIMFLNLLFGKIISASSIYSFSIVKYLSSVFPGLGIFLVFAFLEEIGWRGYLVPKLTSIGANTYIISVITAIVWATWHMPYIGDLIWVVNNSGKLISFIPRFYLLMFAYSIIYTELRISTGSVWSAVLFHGFTNALQHPMDFYFLKIIPGMEYLVSFSGLFMVIVVAIVGIILNSCRIRKTNHST